MVGELGRCAYRIALPPLAMLALAVGCGSEPKTSRSPPPRSKEIYSVKVDGSDVHPLNVSGIGLARGPDGRIAFLYGSPFPHGTKLAVMNDDGSGLRLLSEANTGSENPYAPSWSRDGRWLAVGNGKRCDPFADCRRWNVSITDLKSGTKVRDIPWGKEPSWAPSGSALSYEGGSAHGDPHAKVRYGVFVAGRDGGGRHLLSPGGLPAWSPNRPLIAFFVRGTRGVRTGLHLSRADGKGQRRLVRSEPIFAWSPDGSRIAYIGPFFFPDSLWVRSLSTGRSRRVAATDHNEVGSIAWSPDGTELVFVRFDYRRNEDRLLIVRSDGSAGPVEIARTRKGERIWTPIFTSDGARVLYSIWPPARR